MTDCQRQILVLGVTVRSICLLGPRVIVLCTELFSWIWVADNSRSQCRWAQIIYIGFVLIFILDLEIGKFGFKFWGAWNIYIFDADMDYKLDILTAALLPDFLASSIFDPNILRSWITVGFKSNNLSKFQWI